jgi:hypothetical protein
MRRDSGIALVKVLLLTLILFAVAAYAARGTRVEVRVAQNDYLGKRASQIAEAGLSRAWRQIEQDLTAGQTLTQEVNGTASFWSAGSSDSTFSGYRFISFGGGSTDGYHIYVSNNSDDSGGSTGDNDKQVLITSIGTISGSQREIQALLVQEPLFGDRLDGKYVASWGDVAPEREPSAGGRGPCGERCLCRGSRDGQGLPQSAEPRGMCGVRSADLHPGANRAAAAPLDGQARRMERGIPRQSPAGTRWQKSGSSPRRRASSRWRLMNEDAIGRAVPVRIMRKARPQDLTVRPVELAS